MLSVESREIRLLQEDTIMIFLSVKQIVTFDDLRQSLCNSGQDGMNGNNVNTFNDVSGDGADHSFDIGGCHLPREYEGTTLEWSAYNCPVKLVTYTGARPDEKGSLDTSITDSKTVPDYVFK
eukprot:2227011-Ditylum_brightwellii.AAC.1